MARYIDAEKLEKEMYHEAFETDSDMQKWDRGCWIRYKMFENCIAQQPTADVVEVVRCKAIDDFKIRFFCELNNRVVRPIFSKQIQSKFTIDDIKSIFDEIVEQLRAGEKG